jgi:TRAP-type C4-dicarboxylate transport system permease small subunit
MKRLFSAIERLSDSLLIFAGILILVMGGLSTYAVGRRYIFQNPEPYSYEISTILLVASVTLAVAGLQRKKRHLVVDFVLNLMSIRLRKVLTDILSPLLGLAFVVVVAWQGLDSALYSLKVWEKSQSSWGEPLFPTKFTVPFGMGLLCLVLLAQLLRGVFSKERGGER